MEAAYFNAAEFKPFEVEFEIYHHADDNPQAVNISRYLASEADDPD